MVFTVEAQGIWKTYPGGVVANRGVSVVFRGGEVTALLGENGAGKTTLVSIVAGLLKPDRGRVVVNGRELPLGRPREALRAGIVLVPQHPRLIDAFTVAENIGLALHAIGKRMSLPRVRRLVEEASERYGLHVDPDAEVYRLSMGEKQRVEILKALVLGARLLMLDEPSTHLAPHEVKALVSLVRRLAGEGRAVVYITHRIREALDASDRIIVMRGGSVAAVLPRSEASEETLLQHMFGERLREVSRSQPTVTRRRVGGQVLVVEDLWVKGLRGGDAVRGVSFEVSLGEVVGVAGVAGNGQRELFEALVGLRRPTRGRIVLSGVDVTYAPPSARIRLGLAIVPEEKLGWAVVPGKSLVFNALLGRVGVGDGFLVDWSAARRMAERIVGYMRVEAPGVDAPVDALSGGNLQRFIVGRELLREPRLLVAMNPTSGLDVVAASMVRRELVGLAGRGAGVLVFSEDLDELLEICDRILVVSRGRIAGAYTRPFNVHDIALAMTR